MIFPAMCANCKISWSALCFWPTAARWNRATNLVIASLLIPYSVFNAAGATWEWAGFYGISIGVEVLLLAFILRSAWAWPRTGAAHLATARTGPGRQVPVPDLP